jgi:putative YhdH/YhfP family quinone oxidoreductase
LGAAEIISRQKVTEGAERPMMKERWAGVVDVVGGETLAAAIKATRYGGAVTCCGLVGSADVSMNVYPFILRGVSLLGVDSVNCPADVRQQTWQRLAGDWKPRQLEKMVAEVPLAELENKIKLILEGGISGRLIVRLP